MHRHYLSFFKMLHREFEQGPPVKVITEFSSALSKYITHLELCYPLSNPFSMGPILRLWSFEQLPKFMIKINMWINYKAPGRAVSFCSQWNVSFWIPKELLLFSHPPTAHFWSWGLSLAATFSFLPGFHLAKSSRRLIEYKKPTRSKHNVNWTAGGLLAQEDKCVDFVESSVENTFSTGSKDYFAFCTLSPKKHP